MRDEAASPRGIGAGLAERPPQASVRASAPRTYSCVRASARLRARRWRIAHRGACRPPGEPLPHLEDVASPLCARARARARAPTPAAFRRLPGVPPHDPVATQSAGHSAESWSAENWSQTLRRAAERLATLQGACPRAQTHPARTGGSATRPSGRGVGACTRPSAGVSACSDESQRPPSDPVRRCHAFGRSGKLEAPKERCGRA